MSIIGLLIAVFATIMVVWLVNQGKVPQPFPWILYAVLVIVWIWVLLSVSGLGGDIWSQRIGGQISTAVMRA